MAILGLAVQLYGPYARDGAKALLSLLGDLTGQLDVRFTILSIAADGWVDINLSGEDAEVAETLTAREIGLRPKSVSDLEVTQILSGKVVSYGLMEGIYVDAGIRQPRRVDILVPNSVLRSQLPYGLRVNDPKRLVQLWCLHEHFPLELTLSSRGDADIPPKAELSERQLEAFYDWTETALDRVIALGAPLRKVRSALKSSRHFRDSASLVRLGLLEVSMLCKLGTDAPGIIHDIGRFLPGVSLHSFKPDRVVNPKADGKGAGSRAR